MFIRTVAEDFDMIATLRAVCAAIWWFIIACVIAAAMLLIGALVGAAIFFGWGHLGILRIITAGF